MSTQTDRMTIAAFIIRHGVSMTCELADHNPYMDDVWSRGASHWKCTLRHGRRRRTVYFSQGAAITGEPKVNDVLGCLASDAAGYENARSLEDWCSEYGYDADSRKVEQMYRAIAKQADGLKRLFPDEYETLLWQTEE